MWIVTGDNLKTLEKDLKILPAINQATMVGNTLHVVGEDAERLTQAIKPYQKAPYHWELSTPTLEDVFIDLTSHREEEEAQA